jgi:Flp pilus assembly protein TadG
MFIIILGMIELARGYMVEHLLGNGARIGARQGIISGATTSGVKTAVKSYLTESGITGVTVTIEVNGDSSTDLSEAEEDDLVTVSVSAPVNQNTWVPSPSYLFGNQTAQFSLRHE